MNVKIVTMTVIVKVTVMKKTVIVKVLDCKSEEWVDNPVEVILSNEDNVKTQRLKLKGRRFQQWVRDQLIECLDVHPEDVESRSIGLVGKTLLWIG